MNKKLKDILISCIQAKEILRVELIQKLWSGCGELNRVYLNNGQLIVKVIRFPSTNDHPRGWNSDLSHKRKVKSYQVETHWYESFNQQLPKAYSPRLIESGTLGEEKYIILEDLGARDFQQTQVIEQAQIKGCLTWLANFHAHYLKTRPKGLWSTGSYWHLETRPEELQVLKDQKLKEAAPLIDKKLCDSPFQTIIHGDAKLANFLFTNKEVAAVDFQYVGGGVGVKDLAYFLSSIYNENELEENESWCLDSYFHELQCALKDNPDIEEIELEWRKLYPFAWCDFYRFLQGWSPGHYKINSYSEKMKNKVLQCL